MVIAYICVGGISDSIKHKLSSHPAHYLRAWSFLVAVRSMVSDMERGSKRSRDMLLLY